MTVEHGQVEGNIYLKEELILYGVATGNIFIRDGGVLELHGICYQNLIVEPGGKVYLHGVVVDNVFNRGGYVEIHGAVEGYVHTLSGDTILGPEATIRQGTCD
jgi:hypothetical protein